MKHFPAAVPVLDRSGRFGITDMALSEREIPTARTPGAAGV
jgi:hypothetical protein